VLAAPSPRLWARCCEALGKEEWKDREAWNTREKRSAERVAINEAIGAVTRERPSAEWIKIFGEAGIPAAPINTIDRTFDDPQVRHLGLAQPVDHPRLGQQHLVASPMNFSGQKRAIRSPTPDIGANTDAILGDLGLDALEIAALRKDAVV
jgi:crotonobetainyl-CoA:carnitine CoA-transferase CaiB-like acyl-CoA transferase